MIKSFARRGTEDIFNGINSKRARSTLPRDLWEDACELLDLINSAKHYSELKVPSSNGLHSLDRDRAGQHAVKINRRYRICFRFTDDNFYELEIVDYH